MTEPINGVLWRYTDEGVALDPATKVEYFATSRPPFWKPIARRKWDKAGPTWSGTMADCEFEFSFEDHHK